MLVDIVQKKASVDISYINDVGQIELVSVPAKFDNWVKCEDDDPNRSMEYKNWQGESVKKVGGYKFQDLNLREFLLKSVSQDIQDKIFAYNKVNYMAVDIEIDIRNCKGFPDPEHADFPISTIQITNAQLSTVLMIYDDMNRIEGTQEYKEFIQDRVRKHLKDSKIAQDLIDKYTKDGELNYSHVVFKSEAELLRKYFEYQNKLFHSIIGWNWHGFDSPYIHKRAVKLGVDHSIASPTRELTDREMARDKFKRAEFETDEEKAQRQYKTPRHRIELDYMEIIKKFDYSLDKTSLSLDAIAYQALDVQKVEYGQVDEESGEMKKGSFLELFLDTDNFLTYSAIDTILLMMIHLRLSTVTSLEMVTYYAKIPIERGFSTIALGDALFSDEQRARGLVFCHEDRFRSSDEDGDHDFEGGFVVDPRYPTGEWVALVDFKSLYPSCGQSLGCSFDNIIQESATLEEQKEAIKLGHRVSMNGTIYDKDNVGTLTRVWDRLIFERYHFKDIRIFIDNNIQPMIEKHLEKFAS